jgi:hypothetical protein
MKKIFMILIILLTFSISNVFATNTEYANIITDSNGDPTGQTVVYELEWISQDTLQVTVSTRASAAGDGLYLYNLTSITPTVSGSELSISGGTNLKTLPFGGEAISAIIVIGGKTYECFCSKGGDGCTWTANGNTIWDCDDTGCGACSQTNDNPNPDFEGAIFVDAENVVFVTEE